VGFLGDEGPARVREAYPGSTWDRLAAIKRRYDPANLFRRNHNIPPAAIQDTPTTVTGRSTVSHSHRSAHAQPCNHPRMRPWMALLFGLVALIAAAVPAGIAAASPPPGASAQPYLGTWNYDQPDQATMRNIAVLSCPPDGNGCASSPLPLPLSIPQIGNIVFSAAANGMVAGQTDQGCTWRFAVTTRSLELSPPGQFCFNHNIGSSYTLTRWSVTVVGNHERETIIGVSHQPTGDLVTTMNYGARTRVSGVGGFHAMARFLGGWTYDPASPQTLVNMVVTVPSGAGVPSLSPVQGTVRVTSERYGAITAHTADGCRWTLAVQGNTAELDPATQTCQLATGTVTLLFWSAASDGEHENSVMAGSTDLDGQQSNFYLYIGALTKQ
jgi:Berberine and berberine like